MITGARVSFSVELFKVTGLEVVVCKVSGVWLLLVTVMVDEEWLGGVRVEGVCGTEEVIEVRACEWLGAIVF